MLGSPEGHNMEAIIYRINNHGVDYIESVMNSAFTQSNDEFLDIKKLNKTEQIKKFATKCLNYPATAEICKATYDAIINHMVS